MSPSTASCPPTSVSVCHALEGLPLPTALSAQQLAGTICAWCGTGLTPGNVRDLGARPDRDGQQIFPRGCTACVTATARRILPAHLGACDRCRRGRGSCEMRRALQQLAQEDDG